MSDTALVSQNAECPMRSRIILNVLGYLFFGLGVLGMFLPVMPTTVFWILGAVFFAKSNRAFYRRIVSHRRYGRAVQDMVEKGVISKRSKCIALCGMSVAGVIILATISSLPVLLCGFGLLLIGAVFVGSRPGKAPDEEPVHSVQMSD